MSVNMAHFIEEDRKMNPVIDSVRVERNKLLTTLSINLRLHKEQLAESLAARRLKVAEYMEDELKKLASDPEYQVDFPSLFPMPSDHSGEYERAIRMIEMTEDSLIELSETQFDRLVMDNWGWKQDFLRTTHLYGGR